MSKRRKTILVLAAAIALGTAVTLYFVYRPSDFELAARDLPAAKAAARKAGLALTWDEYHRIHNTPIGPDLLPIIKNWKVPIPNADDMSDENPAKTKALFDEIWLKRRNELMSVVQFADYERFSHTSSAELGSNAGFDIQLKTVYAIAFLCAGSEAAMAFGEEEDSLLILEESFQLVELIDQEPTILSYLTTNLCRSYIAETAERLARANKDNGDFLRGMKEIYFRNTPDHDVPSLFSGEIIDHVDYYDRLSTQSYDERFRSFLARYPAREKATWMRPDWKIYEARENRRAQIAASDPFACKGVQVRYIGALAELKVLLVAKEPNVKDETIAEEWYLRIVGDSDRTSQEVTQGVELIFNMFKHVENTKREHAGVERVIDGLIRKIASKKQSQ